MIYKAELYRKELRRPFLGILSGKAGLLAVSVLLAFASIGLQTLFKVAHDLEPSAYLPALLSRAILPFAYTYNFTAFIFFAFYFFFLLGKAPDFGVGTNKWYLISKAGYNVALINIIKVASLLLLVLFSYAAGFIFSFLILTFFQFEIEAALFWPALISGSLQVLLLSLFATVSSLFSDAKGKARSLMFSLLLLNELLKLILGYYALMGNVGLLQNLSALFMPQYSVYGVFSAAAAFILLLLALNCAKEKAGYYFLKNPFGGFTVVRYSDSETLSVCDNAEAAPFPAIASVLNILMGLVLSLSVIFNTVYLLNLNGAAGVLSFTGYVPYISDNSRLEPVIGKNDFVVIKTIEALRVPGKGEIVFLTEDSVDAGFDAMSVVAVSGESITLDYLNYQLSGLQASQRKTINRDKIYGLLFYSNRQLGFLAVFSASTEGRVLTIILPLAFLLFSNRIFAHHNNCKKTKRKYKAVW